MLTHGTPRSFASPVSANHITGIWHVRAQAGLIWLENVCSDNLIIYAGHIGCVIPRYPNRMSLLFGRLRVIGVGVTLLHHLMEDAPDSVEVGLFRFSNRYHSPGSNKSALLSFHQGINNNFPVVFRPSRSRWAC